MTEAPGTDRRRLDAVASLPDVFYRLGRQPDVWQWPDWRFARDKTFGNRWDDPEGIYRVLYASAQRFGCFLEVLARFRPDPRVVADLGAIVVNDAPEGEAPLPETASAGEVPRSWMQGRGVGRARVEGHFADVASSRNLAELTRVMAADLVRHRVTELDASAIRASAPRALTQRVSRYVFEAQAEWGGELFAGIFYRSRLGDDIDNYAIFEGDYRALIQAEGTEPIVENDPDLLGVFALFHLRWG